MSCSADLPFVGRSAVVEATKEEKPQTVRKRRSALHWTSKKSPLGRGGWRAAADGVGGWSVATHPRAWRPLPLPRGDSHFLRSRTSRLLESLGL